MEWILSNKIGLTFVPFSAAVEDTKGIPRQKFTKGIIKIGKFVKASAGSQFEVTSELLDNWIKQFSRMQANGVKVPIPNMHHNDGDPKNNMGYVTSLFRKDDMLHMTCELIGKDAIEAAAKSDVSIKVDADFTDGDSNVYDKPIMHIAMCTDPVVTGLGDFVAIAASMKGRKMDFEIIKKALGIEEAMTAENAQALILSAGKKASEELKELKEKVSELNAAKTVAVQERETIEASLKDRDKKPEPDKTLVTLSRKNLDLELKGLVADARLTPAARDKFVQEFGTNEAICLSIQSGTEESVEKFIAILRINDPVKLKETSRAQLTTTLSQSVSSDDDNALVKDAERRAREAKEVAVSAR